MKEKLAQLNELISGYNRLFEEEKKVRLQKNKAQNSICNLYKAILEERNPDTEEKSINDRWIWGLRERMTIGKVEKVILEGNRLTTVMKEEKKE